MKKLRVALIGYGRSGRDIHAHMLSMLPDMYEIVAAVDADAQRRDMIRSELGVEPLDDYTQLFERKDIDFVINASFSIDHAPISCELLRRGFTVLSEKPAAHDVSEFDHILATAREAGSRYYVFQLCRFAPEFRRIKQLIADGEPRQAMLKGYAGIRESLGEKKAAENAANIIWDLGMRD